MSGVQYVGAMTPEQESRTIQSAKLRATWQRFATSHQIGDIEATNASLDIHLKEMRSVYGFHHDTLQQSLTSSLSKQQEAQLNLKNHQNDLPKILAKELENQMSYLKEVLDAGGDATLPLSRAHGLILYLVILSRCSENIQPLSAAHLDVSISYAAVVASQTLTKTCAAGNNANSALGNVKSNQAVANWLQAIFLEITCYYSFMCDRQNNWMNIVKSCKEETLLDALALDDPACVQPAIVVFNLNAHSVINTTARGNFRIAINGIFNSKDCKVKHKLLALDLLGTFLCGGEETACGIINDSTFTALLSLINTCPEHRDLVIQCVLIYIQQTHNSRPDKRQIDVRSLLSIYLQEISQKAKDEEYDMLSLYIDLIPRILRVKDRPSLQSSFLGVFVFDKLFRVLSECNSREAVMISCIRAYSALMRKSSSSKEEFEAHIGYLKMLENIKCPSLKIVQAILDMIVEGPHRAEFTVIQNLELLKVFLKWSFTSSGDPENELLSYSLDRILDIITANMLSVMRCSSGGIITVITSFLSSPSRPLSPQLVEQLLAIVEKIGGYSISAIEVRQFILLFQVDHKIPNFTERLQVSLERMAKGKGAEGPNHFFDLQHQTAGITVPEIKVWPHGKNCYTFVCWFKLDLKSAGRRPMSPDTAVGEERYTLYSFYNANGYGFEGFFRPDGTLHIAVCNKKEFTTTSVDHNFLDNKWHFLGISHRGSPLLGMGEVFVRIDKKLTNKLQLASINCNQPFTSNTIGGAGLRQANSKDRRGSANLLTEFGSFISSKTTANKDVNVVTVTPGLQDEHYGIPTSLHGQLGPVALFWESLSPQELIDIHTVGLNNLALFQPHYAGPRKETLCDLSDKLILYYSAKASKEHVVLDLVANKTPAERLNGRLTGHNLSTWNIKDILACVGGVQLIFPLLESIGPVTEPATPISQSQLKPVFLRSHYTSDSSVGVHEGKAEEIGEDVIASGNDSPAGFDVVQESGSIQSLPDEPDIASKDEALVEKTENRVARFIILLEEMLRDCPTNQESLLSTNGFAVIGALLINIPPDELNMQLVKSLQSLCLLLSHDVNPINSTDEAYSPLLHDIYQHILFNFELWSKVDHEVRIAHIQYLSVIIKDNLQLCRRLYGVQFMLDAVRLYCSSNIEQPDTACVLRRAIFGFVKFYMRHGIQLTEVKSILSFIAVTPDLDQKLEAIELITILVEVPPTSLPLARCLASQDAQDLLVGLLHTPCNELKTSLLKLVRTVVDTCCKNKIPLHPTHLCYVGEAVMACSIDGNPEIVNELLATVSIVVNTATELNQQPDVLLMQSLVQLLPRFGLTTRLHVCQELLVLTRTNLKLGEQYSLLPSWYNAILCLMLGCEEEGGLQEQLFVTIMELLHTILWRFYEKAGSLTKDQIGRILLTIDDLEKKIFKSTSVIKMRLFELIVHSMNLELKRSGYDGAITADHTSLLELLEHFMFSKEEEEEGTEDWSDLSCVKKWSSKLVQEILLFFNLLGVWDGKSDMELYRISLRVLLGCLHHHSYEYVSTAASKLHTLLDHPYFESYYTASYVLGALHFVIAPTLEDEVNQLHILLVPLVHTALTRWGTILGLDQSALDQLPSDEHSPDFMDDFLMFIDTHEWENFISNQVYPAVAKFSKENNDTAVAATAREFLKIQELLEDDIILMNQARMERLEGYEKDITAQYKKRHEFEVNRHILDTNGRHNKHHAIIKEWKERKKFMTSDRGVWGGDGNKTPVYWKRDTHENYSRMRLRLCPNNEFNPHSDAKFYDEYDVIREENTVNLLGVSEEARIRADKETQESWEVVMNSNIPDVTDEEQLIFFEDCHLVTLLNIIPGTLKVTPTHIYFYEHEKDETHHKLSHNNLVWKIKDIREIHLRRYNLRYSAIEFFLTDQTNHFINLSKYHRNKVYSKIMSLRPVNLVHGITRTPEEMVASSNITKKWMERRISNFEYLMNLNTIAGRTYNDLSQYPVFPWVLTDYTSDSIDFENPLCECFRDLSKPIGAQVPERAEHADIKYHSLPQDGLDPPFHWGTHYSNPGAVLYFLVRVEPYTSLHIDLHGRFDHPDRHFYNVGQSYNSSTRGQGDCKELIPEFFYLPEFLVNSNGFDFGNRHDGKPVGDVILPNWAKSPEDFIVKHRAALESEYVSNHINDWIDLIFGYKQRGQAAIEALNVYHYTSYEGMVDLDNEKDPKKRRALEAQISNFGQTPRQIFKEPHPKRMNLSEASSLKGSNLNHILRAAALKANAIQMGAPDNPLIFVGVSAGTPNLVIERGVMDNLVTISKNGVYGIHNWLARWTGAHPFYCEKDTQLEEGVRCVSGPFTPGARTPCNLVRLSSDGRVIFTAGLWDNSIRTGRVNQHEIIPLGVLYQHKNVVSCMELDGKFLATGGRDTTVVIWKLERKGGACTGLKPHPSAILYGHNSEVTCVALSQELDVVVSGSTEGIVLIHTLKLGTYIRTLVPHTPADPDSDHFTVSFVGIASNGNLVIAGKLPSNKGGYHSVIYLFTINGKLIKRAKLEDETSAMFLEGDRVVLGGATGSLEIRDTDYINIKHKLRLKTGVVAIAKDPRNQHLFVTTTDGKLLILTPTAKPFSKGKK